MRLEPLYAAILHFFRESQSGLLCGGNPVAIRRFNSKASSLIVSRVYESTFSFI